MNAFTTVDSAKTIGDIVGLLTKAGSRSVRPDFGPAGLPVALEFDLPTAAGIQSYRLPVRVEPVKKRLEADYAAGLIKLGQSSDAHANRVAWRILFDWLKVQFALRDAGMVEADEVLLPYMLTGGQTLYELFVDRALKLPPAGETSHA